MAYFFELLKLLVILSVFVGGMYFVLKKIKKGRFNKLSSNRMIQVIDGVQVGMKEEIVLMKVGKEYILLSMSSGHMIPLKQEEIVAPAEEFDEYFARQEPNLALKGLAKSFKERMVKK